MKSLEKFIFESVASSNFKKLFEIAKLNKARNAHKFDQLSFPKTWKEFDSKFDLSNKKLEESRCFWNAIEMSKTKGFDLCCGFAVLFNRFFEEDYENITTSKDVIVKPFYYVFPHAWNMKDGKIIDTTLKNETNYSYFGETVDLSKFKDGHDLMNYVNKAMNRA